MYEEHFSLEKPVYRKQRHSSYLENSLEERAVQLARYMVENNATVRQTATVFGVSKSTVHKDGCGIMAAAASLCILSPVDSENRRLSKDEKVIYKKTTCFIVIFFMAVFLTI